MADSAKNETARWRRGPRTVPGCPLSGNAKTLDVLGECVGVSRDDQQERDAGDADCEPEARASGPAMACATP